MNLIFTVDVMNTLRIARPTDRLPELARMYELGLGLERLGHFDDHAGFDGVMLGRPGLGWHLEFVHERGAAAGGAPSEEHLLVFYLPSAGEWRRACSAMVSAGFRRVPSHNPYWERDGATFEDLDGYRVVLQNAVSPV